LIQKQKPAYG